MIVTRTRSGLPVLDFEGKEWPSHVALLQACSGSIGSLAAQDGRAMQMAKRRGLPGFDQLASSDAAKA